MKFNFFNLSSILKKFLIFNLIIFLVLGVFTFLYLNAIKPNLVQNRSEQHARIINNTSDHIERLNIKFNKESIIEFLLSTRFLFQNLDRVQFYDLNFNLLADTDTLDLVKNIFVKNANIKETPIDKSLESSNLNETSKNTFLGSINVKSFDELTLKNKIRLVNLFVGEKIGVNSEINYPNEVLPVVMIDTTNLKQSRFKSMRIDDLSQLYHYIGEAQSLSFDVNDLFNLKVSK